MSPKMFKINSNGFKYMYTVSLSVQNVQNQISNTQYEELKNTQVSQKKMFKTRFQIHNMDFKYTVSVQMFKTTISNTQYGVQIHTVSVRK